MIAKTVDKDSGNCILWREVEKRMSRTVDSLKGKDNGAGSGTMTGEKREKGVGESIIVAKEKERALAQFLKSSGKGTTMAIVS